GGPFAALRRIELAPLTFGESLRLLSEVAGPAHDDAVFRMLVTASRGNPGTLLHNFGLLTGKQRAGEAPLVFPFRPRNGLDTARGKEVDESSSSERSALLARLSCSRLTGTASVRGMTGDVDRALEDLLSEGIVVHTSRYLRIRDPLLRSRVYWSLDRANRARLHSSAALAESPLEPGLIAWHRSWAEPGGASPGELLSAATTFVRQGFPLQGVELAERALVLDGEAVSDPDALFELAEEMFVHGELAHARRYCRLLQHGSRHAAASPRLSLLRTRIEFMSTQQLPGLNSDDWVGTHSEESVDDVATSLAAVTMFRAERWEIDAALDSLRRARALLSRCSADVADTVELASVLVASLGGDPAPALKALERVSHRGLDETGVRALLALGRSLTFVDRYAESRRVLKAIINRVPAPQPLWLETAKYALAENEILAGNQFEAIATIERLDGEDTGAQLHRNFHLVLMSWYWQAQGNQGEADAAIAECDKSLANGDNLALSARLVSYQGRFALLGGRLDEAIGFLKHTETLTSRLTTPNLLRYLADLVEAYVLSGRLPEALALCQELRAKSKSIGARGTMLAIARAQALVTDGERSVAAFEYVIKSWHPGDSPFELGRTLLSYADRLASLNHIHESREQYFAARIIFTQLGATMWARKSDMSRPGDDPDREHPLLSRLTADERQVAVMVCQGLRNKEIATQLFVSLRTVEVRLTKIYHKLGARSRAHLIAMLSTAEGLGDDAPLRLL
ncbi:MAG TPA: LuxR C-terminal-related transcriptional regulator, partial [Terrimesophilobacter sp.]|nr:LuxR C-terminal-related transcriptional regulator [Terrimesophilobacter sp.]